MKNPEEINSKELFFKVIFEETRIFLKYIVFAGVIFIIGGLSWWLAVILLGIYVGSLSIRFLLCIPPLIVMPILAIYLLKERVMGKKFSEILTGRTSGRDSLYDIASNILITIRILLLAVFALFLYQKFFPFS